MAENKNSFVLYRDIIHTVRKLDDTQAGILFKHILAYVNDENPIIDNIMVELVFEPIKQQLKRDLRKWEKISIKRKESGKLGGIKSGESRKKDEANEASALHQKQDEANEAVSVNVNDNVSVNDNVINNTPFIPQGEKTIDFKFLELIEEDWRPLVKYWIDYKKEKKQAYRGMIALKTMFINLQEISKKDLSVAKEIIKTAIAGNYPSFTESKSPKVKGLTFGEMTLKINGSVKQTDFEKRSDELYYRKTLQK